MLFFQYHPALVQSISSMIVMEKEILLAIVDMVLLSLIKLLKEPGKTIGPDKIPTCFLKLCTTEVYSYHLTFIFQASIHQSRDWKQTNIVPIFKKGNCTQCSNYRPVSLTCISSKILEHIIFSHIFSLLSRQKSCVIN